MMNTITSPQVKLTPQMLIKQKAEMPTQNKSPEVSFTGDNKTVNRIKSFLVAGALGALVVGCGPTPRQGTHTYNAINSLEPQITQTFGVESIKDVPLVDKSTNEINMQAFEVMHNHLASASLGQDYGSLGRFSTQVKAGQNLEQVVLAAYAEARDTIPHDDGLTRDYDNIVPIPVDIAPSPNGKGYEINWDARKVGAFPFDDDGHVKEDINFEAGDLPMNFTLLHNYNTAVKRAAENRISGNYMKLPQEGLAALYHQQISDIEYLPLLHFDKEQVNQDIPDNIRQLMSNPTCEGPNKTTFELYDPTAVPNDDEYIVKHQEYTRLQAAGLSLVEAYGLVPARIIGDSIDPNMSGGQYMQVLDHLLPQALEDAGVRPENMQEAMNHAVVVPLHMVEVEPEEWSETHNSNDRWEPDIDPYTGIQRTDDEGNPKSKLVDYPDSWTITCKEDAEAEFRAMVFLPPELVGSNTEINRQLVANSLPVIAENQQLHIQAPPQYDDNSQNVDFGRPYGYSYGAPQNWAVPRTGTYIGIPQDYMNQQYNRIPGYRPVVPPQIAYPTYDTIPQGTIYP